MDVRDLTNEARRVYYAEDIKHREMRLAQARRWKKKNRAYYLAQQAAARRAAYATTEGKARLDAATARWNAKHPAKRKRIQKAWYGKHGAAYSRKWHAANRVKNPELYIWRNARNRAKANGWKFSIAVEDIIIPARCPILGIKLKKGNGPFLDASPSIDRLNPRKGYVKGNIAVISWRANWLKRDMTPAEVLKLAAWVKRLLR
jgi:hypothetical protein